MAKVSGAPDTRNANFRRLMDECSLTGAELAKRTDTHPVTVSAWSTGKANPPGSVIAYLELLAKVHRLID